MREFLARPRPEGNRSLASGVLSAVACVGPAAVSSTSSEIAYLRTARAVRERSALLAGRAFAGGSECFVVRPELQPAVVDRVVRTVRATCPLLDAPLHGRLRHFDAGGRRRTHALDARLVHLDVVERARAKVDLVVPSVLLDAGAGPDWGFSEDGVRYTRSEGLAVASLRLFESGALSASGADLRTEADGIVNIDAARLAAAFQVGAENPLVGLGGRAAMLGALGRALRARPDLFRGARPGGLVDWALKQAHQGQLSAMVVLEAILEGLAAVWPGRIRLNGDPLGDTWSHPALGHGAGALVPFHKLSQWLTMSLVEPLLEAGLVLTDLGSLTPLAEYRNGGLLLDLGVLELRDEGLRRQPHTIDSPVVVEWRALTVALLDPIVAAVGAELGLEPGAVRTSNLLAWATWAAGREVAREARPDGGPPLPLVSDGTVF